MRHLKHKHLLGVKKAHRAALLANLACALIREGRIQTTLAKAKALRPFVEKLITLAKRGTLADRRLAFSRLRDKEALQVLFNEKVEEFKDRPGGYIRIYKTGNRIGDAAEMALIELIPAADEGYGKKKRKAKKAATQKTEAPAPAAEAETEAPESSAEEESTEEKAPADDEVNAGNKADAEGETKK
jgi:large subunit ribosomal protein L17